MPGTQGGSSPLTRGKLCVRRRTCRRHRLIPAHAGKTALAGACGLLCGAHPRSRGENLDVPDRAISTNGSSPLTRGKLDHEAGGVLPARLIPAHAGKTCQRSGWSCSVSAHPRSRGENDGRVPVTAMSAGSSPLTRGKQLLPLCHNPVQGLIPAHAGKTSGAGGKGFSSEAHPRSRGENELRRMIVNVKRGSSPLTRGKQ